MPEISLTKQDVDIVLDALDAYIENYASKSSSLVYSICADLRQRIAIQTEVNSK